MLCEVHEAQLVSHFMQVSDPRAALEEAQVGALHAAAALFSLEAGGANSGSLAGPSCAQAAPRGRAPPFSPARGASGRGWSSGRCALAHSVLDV
jgi:hypothetical protein